MTTADKVIKTKPGNCQTDRTHDSAECAGAGEPGDQITQSRSQDGIVSIESILRQFLLTLRGKSRFFRIVSGENSTEINRVNSFSKQLP